MASTASTRSFPTGIDCPIADCDVTGSVPGLKRHILKKHGQDWTAFFPADDSPVVASEVTDTADDGTSNLEAAVESADLALDDEFSSMKADALKRAAKAAQIPGWHKMVKSELQDALRANRVSA